MPPPRHRDSTSTPRDSDMQQGPFLLWCSCIWLGYGMRQPWGKSGREQETLAPPAPGSSAQPLHSEVSPMSGTLKRTCGDALKLSLLLVEAGISSHNGCQKSPLCFPQPRYSTIKVGSRQKIWIMAVISKIWSCNQLLAVKEAAGVGLRSPSGHIFVFLLGPKLLF